ncbi:MotB family protein [Manganibacter manganicus]|uniref:Flagellar motor protein MotB n=1 Tax=Manganibacter manganicus TaxID=1873176 RepID=A0A1V8RVA2_9HYPH|nr:MotB family protein [Pseudaminobacter manganicus]OQM77044.1 flagellar motor protein MotB [Pseudaminobacter manganicus]
MNMDQPRQEIIIVRRNRDDHDDAHHGGVWKIAFADFMTALMCFFLVMWLINAANDQTKSAVASYFNPIKLMDRNTGSKGLSSLGTGQKGEGPPAGSTQEDDSENGQSEAGKATSNAQQSDQGTKYPSDEKLFTDPYAVLAEIAMDAGTMQNVSRKGEGGAQTSGPATGASGGQSYRDPFAPDFWSQQVATPLAEASAERPKIEDPPLKPGDKAAEAPNPKTEAVSMTAEKPLPDSSGLQVRTADTATELPPLEKTRPKPTEESVKAAAQVEAELAEAFKPGETISKGISVEATDKGVVISITDQLDFGMFQIGSATPSRDLVLAMDKIGRIVEGQKGRIVIQGHTDARPFKGDTYDNWRLSTARAHAAYYMLVRGGVDEARITEVAGFADRQLKDKNNPLSAVNRRIEILLETD